MSLENELRVALLLSGNTRSIKQTVNNIKDVSTALNADIFIHTWKESNSSQELDLKLIAKELKPIRFGIEVQSEDLIPYELLSQNAKKYFGSLYMLHGICNAYDSFKSYSTINNIKYDLILRHRFDLMCDSINIFKNDIENIKPKNVLMLDHNWASAAKIYSDIIFAAHVSDFDNIIMNLRKYYVLYLNERAEFNGVLPEEIISTIIKNCLFDIKSSRSAFEIIRNDNRQNQKFSYLNKCKFYKSVYSIRLFLYLHCKNNNPFLKKLLTSNTNFITRFFSQCIFYIKIIYLRIFNGK